MRVAFFPGLIAGVDLPLQTCAATVVVGVEQILNVCVAAPLFQMLKLTVPAGISELFESFTDASFGLPAVTVTVVTAAVARAGEGGKREERRRQAGYGA